MRAAVSVLVVAVGLGTALDGVAQDKEPAFTAPPGSSQATPSAVQGGTPAPSSDQLARTAVNVFRRTCLTAVGQPVALVDAALGMGLAPYLGGTEGEASLGSFLGDAPGQVYSLSAMPDVLVAIGNDGLCTVWAQRASGPRLKQDFIAAVEALRTGGTTVRAARDRKVQRGSGWRHQLGYDVVQPTLSFSADAVTLFSLQPGLQVMRAAPKAHASGALMPIGGAVPAGR